MRLSISILFFLLSFNIYAQEEFFMDSSGVSLGYVKGLYPTSINPYGAGFSVVVERFVGEINLTKVDNNITSRSIGISYIIKSEHYSYPRAKIGFFYTNIDNLDIFGLNMGVIKTFFPNRKFPFSMSAYYTIYSALPSQKEKEFSFSNLMILGYTQAFFANNIVYPFISTSISLDVDNSMQKAASLISLGLNIKI